MTKKITLEQIKKLRTKTKAGVMDCRQALEESKGDLKKAEAWLKKKGLAGAAKRANRETRQGFVGNYCHHSGGIGVLVLLTCETDFVAKNEAFKKLAMELAMQVAGTNPKDVKELLAQPWIRDEKKKIEELVKDLIAKTGENIVVKDFKRLSLDD